MKADVYQKVTDKIIADLEKGELSWLKPWSSGDLPLNFHPAATGARLVFTPIGAG